MQNERHLHNGVLRTFVKLTEIINDGDMFYGKYFDGKYATLLETFRYQSSYSLKHLKTNTVVVNIVVV